MAERIADASRQVARPAAGVRTERGATGLVTLHRVRWGPLQRGVARLLRVPAEFTVHLDALGSQAWGLLDGQRTVGQVRAELARLMPQEGDLSARLGKFLGAMASHRMIVLD